MRRQVKNILLTFLCLAGLNIYAQFRITENLGQWQPEVKFRADLVSAKLFVANGELCYLFYDGAKISEIEHNPKEKDSVQVHVVKVKFLNANPQAQYAGQMAYSDYSNYFRGNNPNQWKSQVKSYHKLYIKDIYKNIDFELFEDKGRLKYNFIVLPGGNPNDIQIQYNGADSVFLKNETIQVNYTFGAINELKPLVYQMDGDLVGKTISSNYALNKNVLSFRLNGKRNLNQRVACVRLRTGNFSDRSNIGFFNL